MSKHAFLCPCYMDIVIIFGAACYTGKTIEWVLLFFLNNFIEAVDLQYCAISSETISVYICVNIFIFLYLYSWTLVQMFIPMYITPPFILLLEHF